MAVSRRTGTRGDSQPAGPLPSDQAVGYSRYVHHDSEQSRHFCALRRGEPASSTRARAELRSPASLGCAALLP